MWTLRADREYEALKLGETWQAKSWNEEVIERSALRGSPKACLDMNDIYRRGGKEKRMMADFWWQLRNRHLDQQYYEDPLINRDYDGWTEADWKSFDATYS